MTIVVATSAVTEAKGSTPFWVFAASQMESYKTICSTLVESNKTIHNFIAEQKSIFFQNPLK